jgi:hypothetical protein
MNGTASASTGPSMGYSSRSGYETAGDAFTFVVYACAPMKTWCFNLVTTELAYGYETTLKVSRIGFYIIFVRDSSFETIACVSAPASVFTFLCAALATSPPSLMPYQQRTYQRFHFSNGYPLLRIHWGIGYIKLKGICVTLDFILDLGIDIDMDPYLHLKLSLNLSQMLAFMLIIGKQP